MDPPMTDLGPTLLVALLAALALGALAHRLGLTPMIGYIAAGLAVGPFTPGFIANREQVLALADIGVALLMFSIGLRFSVRELLGAGRVILIGTPIQMAVTIGVAFACGTALGWPPLQALFIGAAVSVASTVVMAKVAGEATLSTSPHGRIAISVSVIQDLVTVVLVVLLTALSSASGEDIGGLLLRAGLAFGFVVVIVLVGSRVLPRILAQVAHLGSRELFVIAVAVVAIGTAFLANAVGVSVALGAFVAGLALADSDLTASVLGEIVPLRELFSTFFFVSIGILLEPEAIIAGLPIVLLLLALITFGKAIPIAGLAWLAGARPSTAARTGGLLAQSGEFSFVLASAGIGVGAIGGEVFSMAMGAVVISILLAEPISRAAGWLGDRLDAMKALQRPLPGEPEPAAGLRRHAVIIGYGRVGHLVARVLQARGFGWVAIDGDYSVVRSARSAGAPLIFGEAGSPVVLDEARVAEAHMLLVAIPDPLATRQAVEHARRRNPRLEIVARAHSEADEAELRRLGVARVVVAEREVGNELLRHALRGFGVSDREAAAMLEPRRRA
jgi:CPA2 family monovalent cation:H+ antiporter-2